MATISYKARVFLVSGEQSLYRDAPIQSFSVAGGTAKVYEMFSMICLINLKDD